MAGGVNSAVDATSNEISLTAHGYATGQLAEFTTTGTLPAPLLVSTDYYLIVVDANTFMVAASLEDAEAGDEINLSDQGSSGATNTVDIEDLTGASVVLQKSLGDYNIPFADWAWEDVGNAQVVTPLDAPTAWFEEVNPTGNYYRLYFTVDTGVMTASTKVLAKGIV